MKCSPIVIFTYNRPEHTRKTISALLQNPLANETEITIHSDAPNSEQDVERVDEVREYLGSITGFKSTTIVQQRENQGLAKSIITGVTNSIEKHGRTIVLEDDMLTSPHFLTYMNKALDFYDVHKRVMHVAGWSYPISGQELDDCFLWRGMNCWGWATWADRWAYFEKDVSTLFKQIPFYKRRRFDLMGRRKYWSEVARNSAGSIDTWAVFWYATIYLRSGLCVNPTKCLVQNIGLDGTGLHCPTGFDYLAGQLSQKSEFKLQAAIKENPIAFERILEFYDKHKVSLTMKVLNRLHEEINKLR